MSPSQDLHIFDKRLRHTVFSVAGALISSVDHDGMLYDIAFLEEPPGSRIEQIVSRSASRVGLPFHHVDKEGGYIRSFGNESQDSFRVDRARDFVRWLAPAGRRFMWSAPLDRYSIEFWSVAGELQTILQGGDWRDHFSDIAFDRAVIQDIRIDGKNRLWLLILIYRDAWDPPYGPDPEIMRRHVDTAIEVIDVERGRLVAWALSDFGFLYWLEDRVLTFRKSGDHLAMDVWRVSVDE